MKATDVLIGLGVVVGLYVAWTLARPKPIATTSSSDGLAKLAGALGGLFGGGGKSTTPATPTQPPGTYASSSDSYTNYTTGDFTLDGITYHPQVP